MFEWFFEFCSNRTGTWYLRLPKMLLNGDNRVRLTPDNLETNLFLNYNLNYDMDSLESPPTNFRFPNSPHRDPRDSGEESGDESIAESADEDSEL